MPGSTALVAVGPPPWSTEAVKASREYKLLVQFSSPKDINVTICNTLWPGVAGLPDFVKGKVLQWQNKERIQLRINWLEPDGTWKYDTDDLHTLLAHGLKLLTGPRGEALHLRGAARVEEEAAAPKGTIEVTYTDGALEKVQTWTVEPNPEAVTIGRHGLGRWCRIRAPSSARTSEPSDFSDPFVTQMSDIFTHDQPEPQRRSCGVRTCGHACG